MYGKTANPAKTVAAGVWSSFEEKEEEGPENKIRNPLERTMNSFGKS